MMRQSAYSDYPITVCVSCNLISDCCTEFVQEIDFELIPKSHQFYLTVLIKKKKGFKIYKTHKLSNKNLTSRTVTTKERYMHCITSS